VEALINLIVFLVLITAGYFAGQHFEKQHYISIKAREKQTLHIPMTTFGAKQALPHAHEAQMFVGNVVVANDYFKTFSAGLQNLVGGRMGAYESLIDRGRREALLRMKEEAIAWGASQVINVRFETSSISGESNQKGFCVEVMAYGTGIR
jgi:uncharacterized protein YbjQ (UPF0145 family)